MERQLSFDAARAMATAALETCRKNGYRVSVTVVDNAGDVRAAYRDDGTPPHTYDASFRKAFTARTYRISTIEFAKRIATESDRPGLAMIKDALGLPGRSAHQGRQRDHRRRRRCRRARRQRRCRLRRGCNRGDQGAAEIDRAALPERSRVSDRSPPV